MMNWPNKTQGRVLRELAEVTAADSGYFPEERLAKRLDMPVEEVRRHLRALADPGMVEEALRVGITVNADGPSRSIQSPIL